MKIKNEPLYLQAKSKNLDEGDPMARKYGEAIFRFAEAWANLMEEKLKENKDLEVSDIAEQTSYDADTEGITGFMYGAAASILNDFWEKGEELRVWHNKKINPDFTGEGVLNPAVITIEVPEK